MTTSLDFTTWEFAEVLAWEEPRLPVTDAYEAEHRSPSAWYVSQKEPLLAWFGGQETKGSGAYTRQEPNTSAKRAYNRLSCGPALVWIAESLEVPDVRVQEAADVAVAAGPDHRRVCGAIRRVLPWELVAEYAVARQRELKTFRGKALARGRRGVV